MKNNIKESIFTEIVVLSSSFVVYWFADSDHTIPIWEYQTTNPEEALKYYRMNK